MANVYHFKDFEGSSHRILIDLIRGCTPRGGRFLDLGSSLGHIGAAVRDHFRHTIGYEYEVACIGALRSTFDEVVIGDLERMQRFPRDVDALVLADVLEHLRNPTSFLKIVRPSLAPGGRLFLSVPNVANLTVRLELLLGQFHYRDRGILDQTHIRFYTMHSIRNEIENAGFRVVKTCGSAVPIRLVVGKWMPETALRALEWLLTKITPIWKSLLAYQIILVAEAR